MMSQEYILLSVEKGVATLKFNRPEILNATEEPLIQELMHLTDRVADDPGVGAVILTGAGKAFSAGGDLKRLEKGFNAVDGREYISRSIPWILKFVQMEKPVIAAVNGLAFGSGFSMALMCDFILASEKARFAQPYVHIGLVPDIGAMYFLPRLIGLPRAKELFVTGRELSAKEAQEWGIVNRVCPNDRLLEEAIQFGEKLAAGPQVAIKLAKRIMNNSVNISLQELLEYESYAQSVCFQTEDHQEGVRAFFEKTPPKFKGR